MDVEIVEFYPIKKTEHSLFGSLHIYLIDYDIDIRGINIRYFPNWKEDFAIFWPAKKVKNEEGVYVNIPIFGFSNPLRWKELTAQVTAKGRPYIKKHFLGIDVSEDILKNGERRKINRAFFQKEIEFQIKQKEYFAKKKKEDPIDTTNIKVHW